MRIVTVIAPATILLSGCASYQQFQDFSGSDAASVQITRPAEDLYQTSILVTNEKLIESTGEKTMACYDQKKSYWQHAESLGHWHDKPDVFDLTLKLQANQKTYLLVKNWIIGITCGKAIEFTPEQNQAYRIDIKGLTPSCTVDFRPESNSRTTKFEVREVPSC